MIEVGADDDHFVFEFRIGAFQHADDIGGFDRVMGGALGDRDGQGHVKAGHGAAFGFCGGNDGLPGCGGAGKQRGRAFQGDGGCRLDIGGVGIGGGVGLKPGEAGAFQAAFGQEALEGIHPL